jgi:hypothetical protein
MRQAMPAAGRARWPKVADSYQALGDPERAEWHLQQGLRRARLQGRADVGLQALFDMASAALAAAVRHDDHGDLRLAHRARDRVRDYSFEAVRVVADVGALPAQAARADAPRRLARVVRR